MLAVGQCAKRHHVAWAPNDSFAEKEAQRQLTLVTGRPHHHSQRRAVYSNFERLFRRELVIDSGTGLLAISEHPGPVRATVAHEPMLANFLPAVGDRAAGERDMQARLD